MKDPRNVCGTCRKGIAVIRYVEGSPDLTAAELARQSNGLVTADNILTHRKHKAAEPLKPRPGQRKSDFAALVRDKAIQQFEAGELDLRDKEVVPGINAGLKAQALIDGREKAKKSSGTAELAFAILRMLGGGASEPLQIEDGLTIEGVAVEVDGETD